MGQNQRMIKKTLRVRKRLEKYNQTKYYNKDAIPLPQLKNKDRKNFARIWHWSVKATVNEEESPCL